MTMGTVHPLRPLIGATLVPDARPLPGQSAGWEELRSWLNYDEMCTATERPEFAAGVRHVLDRMRRIENGEHG